MDAKILYTSRTTITKIGTYGCSNEVDWFDNVTPKQRLDLWNTVTSVLCAGVNNPQNGQTLRKIMYKTY